MPHPANMVMLIADDGKIITTLPIGTCTDGALLNPSIMEAFSSQGDGTLTVIQGKQSYQLRRRTDYADDERRQNEHIGHQDEPGDSHRHRDWSADSARAARWTCWPGRACTGFVHDSPGGK